jgi:hypothetical protein
MVRRSLVLLVLVLAVATLVRVDGLDARTLTHPESYVPRLDFRAPFDSPSPRRTLHETVQRTIDDDNHPPFQLVLMYLWTGAFGTSLFAIRFPSVVFGVLGVLVTWHLARRTEAGGARAERTALLAAALLALNGLHVFWSQHARIWVLVTTLAVFSTALLVALERAPTRAKALGFLAVSVLGLWTEYYYWIWFAAQAVYVVAACEPRPVARPGAARRPPPPLRLMAAALVSTTPMAVFLWSHMTLRKHFVVPKTLPRVAEVLAGNGLYDPSLGERWLGGAGGAVLVVLAAAGAALYARAATRPPARPERTTAPAPHPELRGLVVACALAATALLLGFHALEIGKPKWVLAALVLPAAGLGGWLALERLWPAAELERFRAGAVGRALARDPVLAQAGGTLLLLVLVSLAKPMLVARGLLILAPLTTILVARAATSFSPAASRAAAVALLALAALSTHHARTQPNASADFQALGRGLSARAGAGLPVAVQNTWFAQPVLYYLDQDRNPATTPEAVEAAAADGRAPDAFWLVVYGVDDAALARNQGEALERFGALGYEERERVEVFGGSALRLERARGGGGG